jgi:hypothetical protein
MPDTLVWLRWGQFVDLALVFGAPVTALLLGQRGLGGDGGSCSPSPARRDWC